MLNGKSVDNPAETVNSDRSDPSYQPVGVAAAFAITYDAQMSLAHSQVFATLRCLGSGGRCEVHHAQHPRLPRRHTLQLLRAAIVSQRDYRARFERAADLVAGDFPVQFAY